MLYRFENYALDTDCRELRQGDDLVPLAPQVFDILAYLIRHRERVVSKDDLIAAIWRGRVVSKSADVHAEKQSASNSARDTTIKSPVTHEQPSIVVLPFANLSGDPLQDYFTDGIVEDITTELSRFSELFVIARNTSFTYKGQAVDVRAVGRDLGVRYALEGSVRKVARRVRITGQLIDAESGKHIWAERFESSLEDIFTLQDQMAHSVVGAITPRLEQAEIERAKRKPTESLSAYDCFLRGMAGWHDWTNALNRCAIARCAGSPTASTVAGVKIVDSARVALS